MLFPNLHKALLVGCKFMGHPLKFISLIFGLTILTSCNNEFSDRNIQKKAVAISQKIDSISIKTFKVWSYGRRGDFDIWSKLKSDTSEYSFFYKTIKDTNFVTIYRALNFQNDFHSTFSFDTSKYWDFTFAEYKQSIFRITSVDNHGQDKVIDTSILTTTIFPKQNPFVILKSLTNLKDSLKIIGSFYRPDIGNFVELWLSRDHKLVYLPDNLKLNDKYSEFWKKDFASGKTINKNWVLIHYDNLKEGG
jgi:hypothetical protein